MSAPDRIHHINFLFRDLDAAMERFETLFGLGPFRVDELIERGVRTARVRLGDAWLVLVAPTRADSVPGRYLDAHGEGFFLLSLGVPDLAAAIAAMNTRLPAGEMGPVRRGLDEWQVADLPVDSTFGIQLQLTEDPA